MVTKGAWVVDGIGVVTTDAEAEPLYRRALAIDEKNYGPDHPKIASRLNSLGLLLECANRPSEAEPLYRRGLEINEKEYGPDHPAVASSLNHLAELLQAMNRLREAKSLFQRALAIFENSGPGVGSWRPGRMTAPGHGLPSRMR
jgi:tetratricopeptide (TPR) repeat protein